MPGTVFQYSRVTFPLDGLQDGAELALLDVPGDEQAARARAATIAVVAANPRARVFFPLMLKRYLSERTPAPSRRSEVAVDSSETDAHVVNFTTSGYLVRTYLHT
jgi:hypothetical protein